MKTEDAQTDGQHDRHKHPGFQAREYNIYRLTIKSTTHRIRHQKYMFFTFNTNVQ